MRIAPITVRGMRKVAVILSADVVGYSRLMGDDDLSTLDDIVATRGVMTEHVLAHGGRVIDAAGDEMLMEFPSAIEAVNCAVAVQAELETRNASRAAHRRMRLRIGINVGDVLERDGALYGDGVNIAARLQALGEPGGVCVSAAVHGLVEGRLSVAFVYAGEQTVKNVARPVRLYHARIGTAAAVAAGQGAPAQLSLVETPARSAAPQHNLPTELTSFIGRDAEITAVSQLMTVNRLVTLVGPGGIGKSRLSLQVARRLLPSFADGVWFVELAPMAQTRLLPLAVARVLGVKEVQGMSVVAALLKTIKDRQLLIILDNCEHLIQGCADLAVRLLKEVPGLTLLASSREPLRVGGELSFPVPAMTLPAPSQLTTLAAMVDCEAAHLFAERATQSSPGFKLTEANAADVAHICQRLDGIPLAIELAAARMRTLSAQAIAERLLDRFRLLTGGDRTAVPRQQTLRALIDWSHELLSVPECMLLRRLAVFAGGWTLQAAEAVAAGGDIARSDVLDLLAQLTEKSLVTMHADGGRYRLLETVRLYALERLELADEIGVVRTRHLDWFLGLAEAASPHLTGPDQALWLARLDPEQENLLAASAWCDQAVHGPQAGLRLMFALKLYLFNRGLLQSLRWGTQEALARPGAQQRDGARCRALHTLGQAQYHMGCYDAAIAPLREALAIARELGDSGRAAAVLQALGMASLGLSDSGSALAYLQEALPLARLSGDERELGAAVNALAQLHRMCGEFDLAEPLYEQALELVRHLQDKENIAASLLNLTIVAIGRGDAQRAQRLLLEAWEIAEALRSRMASHCVLAVTAGLAALQSEWVLAAQLLGATQTESSLTRIQLDPADRASLEPVWDRARLALGAAGFQQAERQGRQLSYESAMARAWAWLQRPE